jgi:hypothetical protein
MKVRRNDFGIVHDNVASLFIMSIAGSFDFFEREHERLYQIVQGDFTTAERTWLETLPPRCAMPCTSLLRDIESGETGHFARTSGQENDSWPPTPTRMCS